MKILEISGCNLASLKGEFHLPLDQAPFSPDGLFAIRGATGSGKSTLIDALCLALYDDTPRFAGRGGPKVGASGLDEALRVSATDPRSILHRGAGRGWAQVVFRGLDGHRWRSRWTVYRARDKAAGRLQEQAMELENLDTRERITGKKTEVLAAIQDRVGLTFQQFRRSVLLAQGEFAAFAKADERDRAALLEAMTGTEVYAGVSKAAHQRCAEEVQRLRDLEAEREGLGVLGPEDRAAREAELSALAGALEADGLAQAALRRDLDWLARDLALAGDLGAAEAASTDAEAADRAVAPRREELEQVERAQPLAPLVLGRAEAGARRDDRRAECADLAAQRPAAVAALDQDEGAVAVAQERADGLAAALEALKPALEAARLLDARLDGARAELERGTRTARGAEDLAAAAEAERDAAEADRIALEHRRADLQAGLDAGAALAPLGAAWPRPAQDLTALAEARGNLRALDARRRDLEARAESLAGDLASLEAAEAATRAARQEAQGVLTDLAARIAQDPRAGLEALRADLDTEDRALRRAEALHLRLLPKLQADAAAAAELAALAAAAAEDRAEAAAAGEGLPAARAALEEARRGRDLARAALGLEARRAQLVEGEPCPLCGALDHPWASGSPLAGLEAEAEARVRSLESALQALDARCTAAAARLEVSGAETARLERQRKALQKESAALTGEWAGLAAGLPADPAAAEPHLRERRQDLDGRGAGLSAREAVLRGLEAGAEAGRASLEALRLEAEAQSVRRADLASAGQDLAGARARAGAEAEALERTANELAEALAPLLAGPDLEALAADPAALRDDLEARVEARRALEAELEALAVGRAALEADLARLRALALERRAAATGAGGTLAGLDAALAGLLAERAGLLEGRTVVEVEGELELRQNATARALDLSREAAARSRTALERLEAARTAAAAALARAEEELEAATARCEAALAGAGLAAEALPGLLAWTVEARAAERRELEGRANAAREALAVLDQRRRDLDRHRATPAPARPAADLEAEAAEVRRRVEGLLEARGALVDQLARDDRAREAAAGLAARIAAQTESARVWRDLDAVIGSADGTKFRTFAQSLTLQALLASANGHLARLNPRYGLEPVPGCAMEIQVVDRDMGDEVRALNGLSGGETFLVSLALALGLSSLSASGTAIDSLFIDEGFGTLDAETLDGALGVLDELQSEGRQVGIISHVDGLAGHLGVEVRVEKEGAGRSRVRILRTARSGA